MLRNLKNAKREFIPGSLRSQHKGMLLKQNGRFTSRSGVHIENSTNNNGKSEVNPLPLQALCLAILQHYAWKG